MTSPERSMRQPMHVLESTPAPGPIVEYIDSVVRYAPADIQFEYFSWVKALFGRYDVFHVHFPEYLVLSPRPFRAAIKRMLFRLLLSILRARRTPVVRTVHTIVPHDGFSQREQALLAGLDALARTHVVLNDCTPINWGGETALVPLGHFREEFQLPTGVEQIRGRVLLFGKLRRYKGVPELIAAAGDVATPDVEIRLVGEPSPEMIDQIEDLLSSERTQGARVTTCLRTVSDEEMLSEFAKAELVILPYRDAGNGNSAVALLVLSLDRSILVPVSCLMERLSEEVGTGWVHLMEEGVSGSEIDRALRQIRGAPLATGPQFIDRDWKTIASSYAKVFRTVTQG